jgi:myosin heavy subunit
MESLYTAVQESVTAEWRAWESAVTGSMLTGLNEEQAELEREEETFQEMDGMLKKELQQLEEAKGAEAKEKRRQSLERKEQQVAKVNEELSAMEAQAKALEEELREITEECDAAEAAEAARAANCDAKERLDKLKKSSKASEKKYKMLEGLLLWSPALVNDDNIVVNFNGSLAETSVSVGFDVANSAKGIAACMMQKHVAAVGPAAAKGTPKKKPAVRQAVYSKDARKFASAKIASLTAFVNEELNVKNRQQLPEILQVIEWQVGRIEAVALEISTLQMTFDSVRAGAGRERVTEAHHPR